MILVKEIVPCEEGFTNIHTDIVKDFSLGAKAKLLYMYLMSLPDDAPCDDTTVGIELRMSAATLSRCKKVLKERDYMKTECIAPGTWVTYLGDPDQPASVIRDRYVEEIKDKYSRIQYIIVKAPCL